MDGNEGDFKSMSLRREHICSAEARSRQNFPTRFRARKAGRRKGNILVRIFQDQTINLNR